MKINDEFNDYAQTNEECNDLTASIVEDFKEFLSFHTEGLPHLLCGFIYHEIAQVAYVAAMVNAHGMAIENIEYGGTSDLDGLLKAYKQKFDDSTQEMYEEYLKRGMN